MQHHNFATRHDSGSKNVTGSARLPNLLLRSGGVRLFTKIILAFAVLVAFGLKSASADQVLTVDDASGLLGLVDVATGKPRSHRRESSINVEWSRTTPVFVSLLFTESTRKRLQSR